MLDEAGLQYVKISASNQLDEYVIKSLLEQQAPIDVFGVGTSLVTGQPDAALDGVYKLAMVDDQPLIKLSENVSKITLPHQKQVWRVMDGHGHFLGADAVGMVSEEDIQLMHHPFILHKSLSIAQCQKEALLRPVMQNGMIVNDPPALSQIAKYCRERLALLPAEYKRFENPHIYKVGISSRLLEQRDLLIARHKK
jgi:nicotinate phosphoribosyltransferase